MKYKQKYTSIQYIYDILGDDYMIRSINKKMFTVMGWILRYRIQQGLIFIHMYDGSSITPLQLVIEEKINPETYNSVLSSINSGACIIGKGTIVVSPAKGQKCEMNVKECSIIGKVAEPSTYLPCIKRPHIETIRPFHHLRPKFHVYQIIYRVRSKLLQIIHEFFNRQHFYHLDPNVVTSADCEGAGETFKIVPTNQQDIVASENKEEQKFFGKDAYLTVSSHLQLEALCSGMAKVYTMNPSFRAEKSKTSRHLCSFTHLEWEIAFIDLKDLMDFSEDLVHDIFDRTLRECAEELNFLDNTISEGIVDKLNGFISSDFARVTYTEAIEIIHNNKHKILNKFKKEKFQIPEWGDDLGSYCERFICEDIFGKPTFVHSYPLKLKSFYMKPQNIVGGQNINMQTCDSCDLLIPGTGELIGSSIRQDDYEQLMKEINSRNMDITPLQWYIDLRKNSSFPHGGAGLGFDRLVTICCFIDGNIRDSVPFPVAFGECEY